MNHKALKLLSKIIEIEGVDRKSGTSARKIALKEWISDWVIVGSAEKSVIKSNFTSEETDFIKYHLSTCLVTSSLEEVVTFSEEKYKVRASMLAIRREK